MNTYELPSAAAWGLRCATASGGKEYQILLFDAYTVFGWGKILGKKQYKIEHHGNAWTANYQAILRTRTKERDGYYLYPEPKLSNLSPEYWTDLLSNHDRAITVGPAITALLQQ